MQHHTEVPRDERGGRCHDPRVDRAVGDADHLGVDDRTPEDSMLVPGSDKKSWPRATPE